MSTRKPLTHTRVLDAAMTLVDREGLQSLSMRRLGKELGVEAMSLYHHLPGKEGLLDGLAEALANEITSAVDERPASCMADWKSDLRSRCLAARTVVMRHPWTPALFAARQSIPPSMYLYVDQVIALFVDNGFSYQTAHRALHALGSLLFGFAQELFSPPTSRLWGGATARQSSNSPLICCWVDWSDSVTRVAQTTHLPSAPCVQPQLFARHPLHSSAS